MGSGRKVLKNIVAMFLSTGVERLTNFVLTLYIARALGADSLGQYSIVISLSLIFQTISYLGQQQIIVREVARRPDKAGAFLVNGSLIAAGGGLLGLLLMITATNLLAYEPEIQILAYVASISLVPGGLAIVGEAVIQGLEQMHFVTVARSISGVIKLSFSIPLLYVGANLAIVFLILAVANLALYVVYLLVIRRLVGQFGRDLDRTLVRYLLGLAGPFVIISIFGVVFKQVDILMLGKMKDPEAVGIYAAPFRLIQIGMQFLVPLMLALFPMMSEVFVNSPAQLKSITQRLLKLLMAFAIPLAVVGTAFSEEIILLFYGPGYAASVYVLQILVWVLVLYFVNGVLFRTMLASDNELVTMRVAGINMVASVLLNLLLIPRWGALGVAAASFCTTFIALAQNYAYIARHLFKLDWLRAIGKPALAALLLGVCLLAMRDAPVWLSLTVGLVVYLVLIVVLRVFSPEEWGFVRRTWNDMIGRIP